MSAAPQGGVTAIFVKRPILALVLNLLVLIAGGLAFLGPVLVLFFDLRAVSVLSPRGERVRVGDAVGDGRGVLVLLRHLG